MLSDTEHYILSYYRASELAGSILFGKIALHTNIDEIRVPLTAHCLEEAEHAWLWTQTIYHCDRVPLKVTQTYQTEYCKAFGMPKNTLEVLCLTQVLEKRVLSHFQKHLALPNTQPIIQKTLRKMIQDEQGHIGWIRKELDKYGRAQGTDEVERIMKELKAIDQRVYERILATSPMNEFFGGSK